MILDIVLLAFGIATIYLGGQLLIDGSSSIAKRFGMPALLIGVMIIAPGTSAPELFLGAISAAQGVPGVSVGNVIGSTVAIVTLVLGIGAIIAPIISRFDEVRRESYVAVIAAVLFLLMALDRRIVWWEGVIMLATFFIYMRWAYRCIRRCKVTYAVREEYEDIAIERPLMMSLSMLGLSIVALALGAELAVEGAVGLADGFGISEVVIGATIVSIGTVMPELTITIMAALKGKQDLAIGNVLGTVLFNTMVVTGTASLITDVTFTGKVVFPGMVLIICMSLLLVFVLKKNEGITRSMGFVLLMVYGLFIGLILALAL
ncbi:MAG: calcium/sodium antiporter [Euryarchaeota archaeon]|nr:calcium/sodium antiporter [Euryarchaeota archaeon]